MGTGGGDDISRKIRMADRKVTGAKIVSAQIDTRAQPTINDIYGRPVDNGADASQTGISIFDPVLTELMYKWFCPVNGSILDPFAGGSVRGIVAARLGFNYLGCDLSKRQIEANQEQAEKICKEVKPKWVADDSKNILKYAKDKYDMLFTCPPYGFLEVYSDHEDDISNMDYKDFKEAYREIINKSCQALKDDSFACIVIGEFRDKKTGHYVNFLGDTIQAFIDAGLSYYNEIILVTAIGSLPLRAGRIFSASRKIGKTHQNILVFAKGSPKKATAKLSDNGIAESTVSTGEEL